MEKCFYLDSCIWLNLFKKEEGNRNIPFWKSASDFIEFIMFSKNEEIVYSGLVLKELRFKLSKYDFRKKETFLKQEFKFIKLLSEDYDFARKLESDLKYELSFFDCLHLALCKRVGFVLVTRDKLLLKVAKRFILVDKPENLMFV